MRPGELPTPFHLTAIDANSAPQPVTIDTPVTVRQSNGFDVTMNMEFFSDSNCTTPLTPTNLIIPLGASDLPFYVRVNTTVQQIFNLSSRFNFGTSPGSNPVKDFSFTVGF